MSFHITRIVPVPHDSDPLVDDQWQAVCVREDCPWTSDLWDTEHGAIEAAWQHEQNGDRFSTGEHPVVPEEGQ